MKGRSNYQFSITNPSEVNQVLLNYLKAEGFSVTTKKNETFYKAGDAISGYRGFKYGFVENTLYIQVWLIGAFGEFKIEQNSLNMPAMNYRKSLNNLFTVLANGNIQNNNVETNQVVNQFKEETDKKAETMCQIGFYLSICGLLLSFLGATYGVFVYIMEFYFASIGLKTKKKTLALITIALALLSFIITIIQVLELI